MKCHILLIIICLFVFSEQEKQRRWQEIRIRQHRLLSQSEHATPAHIEQIMKSGFSMSDIKGFQNKYKFIGSFIKFFLYIFNKKVFIEVIRMIL